MHRKKKREAQNKNLDQLEKYRNEEELREFYGQVNNIKKQFKPKTNICSDKDGNILTDRDEILNR